VNLAEELAWWRFYLPRQAVQLLARTLPLAELRDRLPRAVGERLRFGLYPARITDAADVECARAYPPWGDPAELDPQARVRFEAPPRASILLVTYNNLALTRLCLASIQRAAGVLPIEIIVVDNGSTDGSQELLRRWAHDPRVRLILHDRNDAITRRLNEGIARANGEWISLLYSDDYYLPHKLERQLSLARNLAPDYGVIYSPGRRLNVDTGEEWTDPSVHASGDVLGALMRSHAVGAGFVNPITPLIRRDCFARHPFYEDLFVEGETIFFRFALTHRFHFDPEPTAVMRDHAHNSGRSVRRNIENLFVCLEKMERDRDFPATEQATLRWFRAHMYRNASWLAVRVMNDRTWARQMLARCVQTDWKMLFQLKTLAAAGLSLVPARVLSVANATVARVRRRAAHEDYVPRP